jgi:hypothetical protein
MNNKHWYLNENNKKRENAFLRTRREHLKSLGIKKYVELDFYEFLGFKK